MINPQDNSIFTGPNNTYNQNPNGPNLNNNIINPNENLGTNPPNPVNIPTQRKGKSNLLTYITVIVVVAIAVFFVLHFNIINLSGSMNAKTSNTNYNIQSFESAATMQGVTRIINADIINTNALSISYNGGIDTVIKEKIFNKTENINYSIPMAILFAKNGNLFRISIRMNMSSFFNLFYGMLFGSINGKSLINSTELKILDEKVSNLTETSIYNGTGLILCMSENSSYSSCYYRSMIIPEGNILSTLLNESKLSQLSNSSSTNPLSAAIPNENSTFNSINSTRQIFTYKGLSSYNGQECSLDDIAADLSNTTLTGNICFSDSFGMPLYFNLEINELTQYSNATMTFNFTSTVNSAAPSISDITSLPNGATFIKGLSSNPLIKMP